MAGLARSMRRIGPILMGVCLALCCLSVPAPAWADGETLTVGVPVDRPPMFYRNDQTGEIDGIGVDLVRMAGEAAGYSVEVRALSEPTLKDALDSDAYDVVMPFGSTIKSAAGNPTVISDNLIQTPFTLVTTNRRSSMPELGSLRVGMLSSQAGVGETIKQMHPGIEITFFDTMDEGVRAMRAGAVDALLNNSYIWSYTLQKPAYADLVVVPQNMLSMDFRAGAVDTPEGKATIERLNGGIATLQDTNRQAVVLDHTTRRLYKYDFFDYLYQYMPAVVACFVLFASLVAYGVQKRREERRKQEEKVRDLMENDALTGALSSMGFKARVAELIRENPDTEYFLTYANIKDFKYINDSLGRDAGDDLLRYWFSRTQAYLTDKEALGRMGGDRLSVLRVATDDDDLYRIDSVVHERVRNYFVAQGEQYRVRISGGIYALSPEDYANPNVDQMLDYARVAEKRVRETFADGYEFYNAEQWNAGRRNAEIVAHLPAALEGGEIKVWYQPQVDFDTGQIVSAEALCRWEHADLGMLSPAEFIPTLERHDLIHKLDYHVWERVCQDLHRWNEQGQHRSVSVNLSRSDVREGVDIPSVFEKLIDTYDLDVDQLHIEITESAFVEKADELIRTTAKLRELGFRVEMDDFGSGYSSLNMLKEVPVDRIKLDLRFLSGEGDMQRGHVIVSHVIQMIASLRMDLIAEGVETEQQALFLQEHGCSRMQGFHFYKPMGVESFEKIVAS